MSNSYTTSNYDAAMNQAGSAPSGTNQDKGSVGSKLTLIEAAKRFKSSGRWDERFSEFIAIYSNKYPYTEIGQYEDIVVPNMIFSTVNVIVPSIAVNAPKINVSPVHPDYIESAQTAEALVNHQWHTARVQDEVRDAIKDFVIVGHGWAKTTWDSQEEQVDLTAEEFEQLAAQALQTKMQAEAAGVVGEFPSNEELLKELPSTKTELTVDQPLVMRVSPFDMFFDPDAKRFNDMRWIAQRVFMPLEVAKANELWSSAARKKLQTVSKSNQRNEVRVDQNTSHAEPVGQEFVEVYEFYDLITGKMCVFAEGSDTWLLKPTISPYPNIHPYTYIPNYEVPERFFPVGDVETIFPLQVELGMVRTAQVNDRKRGNRVTLYKESALGSQGVSDMKAGKDNAFIPVLNNTPFNEAFAQIQPLGLPPEWYRSDQQSLSDINLVSGVSEYQRGGQGAIRRTATEVGLMQDASNARSSDKLAKVERAMAEIAEQMIRLSQQFLEKEDVARVMSPSAAESWVPYSGPAIQGEFLFKVEAGSTQPMNESFRRQQAMQMMDAFGGLIGSGLLNDQEFVAEIMRLNGITDVQRLLGAGMPDPVPEELPPEQMPPGVPGGPPAGMHQMPDGSMMADSDMESPGMPPQGMGAMPPQGMPPGM